MDEVRTEAINVTAHDGGPVCGKAFMPRLGAWPGCCSVFHHGRVYLLGATRLMVWELRVLCGGWIPSRMAQGLDVNLNVGRKVLFSALSE